MKPAALRRTASLILFIAIAALALSARPVLSGDSNEYILQTQSIALFGELKINTGVLREYWNRTNPFGWTLQQTVPAETLRGQESQAGGGFGALYPDRFHDFRFLHYWAYSLIDAPLYLLLRSIGEKLEYSSFRILNSLFFLLPFLILAERMKSAKPFLSLVLFACSPLLGYVRWYSPEVMCFSFSVSSLLLLDSPRGRFLSPILLGIAASHYQPLLVLFAFEGFYLWGLDSGAVRSARMISAFCLGLTVAASSLIYYWYYFGSPNLFALLGFARFEYASIARAVDFFVNPFTGCVFYFFPVWALLAAKARRENVRIFLVAFVCAAVMAFACSFNANYNSAALGSSRYSTWFLAPIFFCVLSPRWPLEGRRWQRVAFLLVTAVSIVSLRLYTVLLPHYDYFMLGARPEVASLIRFMKYPGSAETFAEKMRQREFRVPHQFDEIYIWDFGRERSLWLVTRRGAKQLRQFQFRTGNIRAFENDALPYFSVSNDAVWFSPEKLQGWRRDTYLGDYIYLWVPASPREIRSDVRFVVR